MTSDRTVKRVERTAGYACAGMTLLAWTIAGGDPRPAVAVLAGGGLIALAYWSLKGAVSVLQPAGPPGSMTARRRASAVLKVAGRYALLGFLAYVMIARLRLHPLGLLAGASSFVAAVSIEALRPLIRKH
jgi:hypothetical protein